MHFEIDTFGSSPLQNEARIGMPVGLTRRSKVIQPTQLGLFQGRTNEMCADICQQFSPGRRAKLVSNHAEAIALTGKTQHGLGEVVAARGVYPTGAQDQMQAATCLDCTLASQLAGTILVEGRNSIRFTPGAFTITGKHVVGGVMD